MEAWWAERKRRLIAGLSLLAIAAILTACGTGGPEVSGKTPSPEGYTPMVTLYQATETTTATTTPDVIFFAGGEMSVEQRLAFEESSEMQQWRSDISNRWVYWAKADKPAVSLDLLKPTANGKLGIPLTPFWDPADPSNPAKAWVAVDIPYAGADVFTLPWVNRGFQKVVPDRYPKDKSGKTVIETGQGPLIFNRNGVDSTGRQWILSAQDGLPVRRQSNEQVIARLDEAGLWQEISEFPTEFPIDGKPFENTVTVDGIDIPISIATSNLPMGIKGITNIRPDIAHALGQVFLHNCYFKYISGDTENTPGGSENLSFSDYENLVKQGQVKVSAMTREQPFGHTQSSQFNPNYGFVIELVDGYGDLPLGRDGPNIDHATIMMLGNDGRLRIIHQIQEGTIQGYLDVLQNKITKPTDYQRDAYISSAIGNNIVDALAYITASSVCQIRGCQYTIPNGALDWMPGSELATIVGSDMELIDKGQEIVPFLQLSK